MERVWFMVFGQLVEGYSSDYATAHIWLDDMQKAGQQQAALIEVQAVRIVKHGEETLRFGDDD